MLKNISITLNKKMFGIKLWIVLFFAFLLFMIIGKEGFSSYPFARSNPLTGWGMGSYINMPTRFTRNQSYDLRGDPYRIPPNYNLSPWGMSGFM